MVKKYTWFVLFPVYSSNLCHGGKEPHVSLAANSSKLLKDMTEFSRILCNSYSNNPEYNRALLKLLTLASIQGYTEDQKKHIVKLDFHFLTPK